jgi:Flp pilus assembly protein TadD
MNLRRLSFVLAALVFSASSLFAQAWRSEHGGRISGIVTDAKGKPIAGAKITLVSLRAGNSGPAPLTTNANGKWSLVSVMGGTWNIDVEAPGYLTKKGTLEAQEGTMNPPVKTVLEPVPAPVEAPPQPAELANTVPPEAVAAVRAAENFMKKADGQVIEGELTTSFAPEKLTDEQKKELYKQAVAEFEKAQALLPDNLQIKQALSQAYYKSGQLKESTALLTQVYNADQSNTGVLLLLINLLLENGQLDEGKALLDKVPAGTMTDPTAMINLGILFMNKSRLTDAYAYFDKAVTLDPKRGESYYYRGLSSLQQQKMAAAKADFLKVVELSPDSSEAKDAQDLLKQIK